VCLVNGVVSERLINEICKYMYKCVFKRKSTYFVGKGIFFFFLENFTKYPRKYFEIFYKIS
jgi:hypothetical protein